MGIVLEILRFIEKYKESNLMRVIDLARIFFRSLSIAASFNFSNMQNVGFAYSLIPLVKKMGGERKMVAQILERHIQFFNSHPHMTGPIIGSVVRLEENCKGGDCPEAVKLKKSLMSPYAAMGDPFFWGALKPLSLIVGVIIAIKGLILAPLVSILIYNSISIWVRLKGFVEGYRDGRGAIDYIKTINMPKISRKIRWVSVFLLSLLSAVILAVQPIPGLEDFSYLGSLMVLVSIIICSWAIGKGVSPFSIIYGSSVLFLIIALI